MIVSSLINDLCEIILKETYSEEVSIVGKDILVNGESSMADILKRLTEIYRSENQGKIFYQDENSQNFNTKLYQMIKDSLIVLRQNNLLNIKETVTKKHFLEVIYSINTQNIMNIMRYPKILYLINTKYGDYGKLIFEIFMKCGIMSPSQNMEFVLNNQLSLKNKKHIELNNIKLIFVKLIQDNYLVQVNLSNPNIDSTINKDGIEHLFR